MTLTPRQLDVLKAIDGLIRVNTLSPTMQELADHFDTSKVTIFGHVGELERKGAVVREKYKSRSIVLTDAGRAAIGNPAADRLARFIGENVLDDAHREELTAILGMVAA